MALSLDIAPIVGGWRSLVGDFGHKEGDYLAFTVTLSQPDGQRVKSFLIGRIAGDRIVGTFVDDAGTTGEWTALREAERSNSRKGVIGKVKLPEIQFSGNSVCQDFSNRPRHAVGVPPVLLCRLALEHHSFRKPAQKRTIEKEVLFLD